MSEPKFCEVWAQSVAQVTVDMETGEEDISVLEEGYDCPNLAVGRYEIETHAGPTMEFDACEEHAEGWEEDGIIVEVVEEYSR